MWGGAVRIYAIMSVGQIYAGVKVMWGDAGRDSFKICVFRKNSHRTIIIPKSTYLDANLKLVQICSISHRDHDIFKILALK